MRWIEDVSPESIKCRLELKRNGAKEIRTITDGSFVVVCSLNPMGDGTWQRLVAVSRGGRYVKPNLARAVATDLYPSAKIESCDELPKLTAVWFKCEEA